MWPTGRRRCGHGEATIHDLDATAFAHPLLGLSHVGYFVTRDGCYVAANRAGLAMFGLETVDHLRLLPAVGFLHVDDQERIAEVLTRAQAGTEFDFLPVRVLEADARVHHVEIALAPVRWCGEPAAMVVVRDVHERHVQEQRMEALRRQLRLVVDHASVGIALADESGIVTMANDTLAALVGVDPTGLLLDHLLGTSEPDEDGQGGERRRLITTHARSECWVRVHRSVLPGRGDEQQQLVQFHDTTEQRRTAAELRHRASHDELTGVANRSAFLARTAVALEEPDAEVAVLFLDLDHFKLVNDSHGHAAGDELLREVAARLSSAVRPHDTVARFGGDEFTVLCRAVPDEATAEVIVRRLHAALEPEVVVDAAGTGIRVRASIGLALARIGETADDLLSRADNGMYAAKRARGGNHQAVVGASSRQARSRLSMHRALPEALVDGQVRAHLQPIVDLGSGRVVGAEALARWQHLDGSWTSPGEFLPAAHDLGLGADLDLLVARTGADALATATAGIETAFPLRLGINVEPGNLLLDDFVENLLDTVTSSGLSLEQLVVEVTERHLTGPAHALVKVCAELRSRGVGVALDDFGTGESSLARLTHLPANILKLDRVMLTRLDDPRQRVLLGGLVDLAMRLDLDVVAEGIETQENLDTLVASGCSTGQGWLFHRDLPPEAFRSLVVEQNTPSTSRTEPVPVR